MIHCPLRWPSVQENMIKCPLRCHSHGENVIVPFRVTSGWWKLNKVSSRVAFQWSTNGKMPVQWKKREKCPVGCPSHGENVIKCPSLGENHNALRNRLPYMLGKGWKCFTISASWLSVLVPHLMQLVPFFRQYITYIQQTLLSKAITVSASNHYSI